jgi:hypothetical protein
MKLSKQDIRKLTDEALAEELKMAESETEEAWREYEMADAWRDALVEESNSRWRERNVKTTPGPYRPKVFANKGGRSVWRQV